MPLFTSPLRIALSSAAAAAVLAVGAARVEAGPPLICHPVEIGTTASLPWGGGNGWDSTVRTYDVSRLTQDTERLLTADAPLRLRMETLRRATIYAARDPKVAATLLSTIVGRVLNAEAAGKPDALAWFDAGYLVESYRQASLVYRWDMLSGADRTSWALKDEPRGMDGHAWVQRAIVLSNQNPAMLQAASLMRERTPPQAAQR